MTAKIATRIESRLERLRRLSVVFEVEIRLKIVTELYKRPMSPKQFYEEFGGGSISRVAKNFKKLEEHGWLRYLYGKGPGGRRRGGIEGFYRAPELAFFDAETWALVPYSIRVACSWNILGQIAPRLRGAMERSAVEDRPGRDLSCKQITLDQIGWKHVIKAVDAQFISQFDQQADAQVRAACADSKVFGVDVFLVAFESPQEAPESLTDANLVESPKEPLVPFAERLSPVLADDLCREIVLTLNRRKMSVTQFHREIKPRVPIGRIRRRFKRLEEIGWIKKVDGATEGQRHGAREQFYRATRPAIVDRCDWGNPPGALQGTKRWRTFELFSRRIKEALRAGSFDARLDRYFTWSMLSLDAPGFEKTVEGINALDVFIDDEQKRAMNRVKRSGEKPVTMTICMAALEAPTQVIKAP